MCIVSPAILISIGNIKSILWNPVTTGTLNNISGIPPGVSKYYSMLQQFHIFINSFNSAWITEINLKKRAYFLVAGAVSCKDYFHFNEKLQSINSICSFLSWPKWFYTLVSCWLTKDSFDPVNKIWRSSQCILSVSQSYANHIGNFTRLIS